MPRLDEASCDAVFCFSSFPHFQDKAKATQALGRILKPGGLFAIAHFASSEGVNRQHESYNAVRDDRLPDEAGMRALLLAGGLAVDRFIDEPGFYCVVGRKR
jgi:demethylmenaquinone methyltransferase/2-methoxy-6-polyprenyl-1,4-benzoquinol methylase